MAKFSKGTAVQQVLRPVTGTVGGYQVDQETGDVLVLVEWEMDGVSGARFFKEEELEAVPASA